MIPIPIHYSQAKYFTKPKNSWCSFLFGTFRNNDLIHEFLHSHGCVFREEYFRDYDYSYEYGVEYIIDEDIRTKTMEAVISYPVLEYDASSDPVGIYAHYYNNEYMLTTRLFARKSYNTVIDFNEDVVKKFVNDINKCLTINKTIEDDEKEPLWDNFQQQVHIYPSQLKQTKNALIVDVNNKKVYKQSEVEIKDFLKRDYEFNAGVFVLNVFCDNNRIADMVQAAMMDKDFNWDRYNDKK